MKKGREQEGASRAEPSSSKDRSLWGQVRCIEHPERIVEQARGLLSSTSWEDIVVGLTITTGRCVPEILKSGVVFPKKPYALLFSAYLERLDEVVGPFELPTLVEADLVLSAWQRVRSQISCVSLGDEEVCARYRPQVAAVARAQFAELVGVDAFADGYTPLLRQVYAAIAARYYCPSQVDRSWFMDLVQGFERSEKDHRVCAQWCGACQRSCCTYEIGNGAGNVDGSLGIKLEQPGYDLLDSLKEWERGEEADKPVASAAPLNKMEDGEARTQGQDQSGEPEDEGMGAIGQQEGDVVEALGHVWTLEEVKAAIAADPNIDDDWDEEDLEVLRLSMSTVIVDKDGNIDRRQGIKLGQPGVKVLEVFQQEKEEEEEQTVKREPPALAVPEAQVALEIGEQTWVLFEEVQTLEEGRSSDEIFTELFAAYDGMYRSGLLDDVKQLVCSALLDLLPRGQDRALLEQALQRRGAPDRFTFLQQAVLAYAHQSLGEDGGQGEGAREEKQAQASSERADAGEDVVADPHAELPRLPGRGVDEQAQVSERKVKLYVSQQTWTRFASIKEDLLTSSNDEVLALLHKAYFLYYYSDPFDLGDQVERVAGTALSCLRLDGKDQAMIKQAMKYEKATDLFAFLQEMVLIYGQCIVDDGPPQEQ